MGALERLIGGRDGAPRALANAHKPGREPHVHAPNRFVAKRGGGPGVLGEIATTFGPDATIHADMTSGGRRGESVKEK